MSDDTIERLAESHIPLVPTLLLLANWADFGHLVGAPIHVRERARKVLDKTAVTLHKAHDAGVKLLAGTDSGFAVTPFGEWHARELELLMDYAGLSAVEAIQAGTQNAAVTLGVDEELGVIAKGMLADLLIVRGDPVQDIRVLQNKENVEAVIKDGRRVQFDEDVDVDRHPYQRVTMLAQTELTYEMVYEESGRIDVPQELPWSADEGRTVADELRRGEQEARLD